MKSQSPPVPPLRTPIRTLAPHVAQALARPVVPISPRAPIPPISSAPVQAKPQPSSAAVRPPAPHVQAALAATATTATTAASAQPKLAHPPPAGVRLPAPHVQAALAPKPVAQAKLRPATPVLPAPVRAPARPAASPLPIRPGLPPVVQPATKRPGFTTNSKHSAFLSHNLLSENDFEVDLKKPGLPSHNAAMPHRMSWKDIRDNTVKFYDSEEEEDDFRRWSRRFVFAGKEKIGETEEAIEEKEGMIVETKTSYKNLKEDVEETEKDWKSAQKKKDKVRVQKLEKKLKNEKKKRDKERRRLSRHREQKEGLELLLEKQKQSQEDFLESRKTLIEDKDSTSLKGFLRQANSFHANVPDLGPHFGVNNPVSEHAHLNLRESRSRKRGRSPSPMSRRVLDMSPERISLIAVDDEDRIITTSGETVKKKYLPKKVRSRVKKHGTKEIKGYDPNFKFL